MPKAISDLCSRDQAFNQKNGSTTVFAKKLRRTGFLCRFAQVPLCARALLAHLMPRRLVHVVAREVDTCAHVLQPQAVQLVLPARERAHQVVLDREAVAAAEERVRHARRPKVAVPVGEEDMG